MNSPTMLIAIVGLTCLLAPALALDHTHIDNHLGVPMVCSTVYSTSGFTDRTIPPGGSDVDEYQNRGNENSFGLGGGLGVKVVGPDGCNLQIQIASDVSIAITPVLDGNGQDTTGFHLQDSSSGHDYGTAVCP